ncbi:MAG: hypothetical protein ACRD82_05765 [Blastocatellia bacterium]
MTVILLDIEEAKARLAAGAQPYEFKTDNPEVRILGPACGFGADCLQRYRKDGMYGESFAEAQNAAQAKSAIVTGVWFVKQTQ